MIHLLSCFFFMVGVPNDSIGDRGVYGWVAREEDWWPANATADDCLPLKLPAEEDGQDGKTGCEASDEHVGLMLRYFTSMYYVLNALENGSTIGERGFGIFAEFMRDLILGLIAGLLSTILMAMNSDDGETTAKLQGLKGFLEERRFPKGFQQRVMEYFNELWTNRSHVNLPEMFEDMPPAMAHATAELLYGRFLSTIPLFRGLSGEVTSGLCMQVQPLLALKGQEVVVEGVPGQEMYMLMKGDVEVSVRGERLGFLSEGAFFGEVPVLSEDSGSEIRTRTVTAVTDSELCYITKKAIKKLKETYPELKARLMRFERAGSRVNAKRLTKLNISKEVMQSYTGTFTEVKEASKIVRDQNARFSGGGHIPWTMVKAQMMLKRKAEAARARLMQRKMKASAMAGAASPAALGPVAALMERPAVRRRSPNRLDKPRHPSVRPVPTQPSAHSTSRRAAGHLADLGRGARHPWHQDPRQRGPVLAGVLPAPFGAWR
jgi:CRP-like cAMP-binding protein